MTDGVPDVVGVRFRNAGRLRYFDAAGMRLEPGEYIVVQTTRGPEIGRVVIGTDQVLVNELGDEDLPPVLRLATDEDVERMAELRERAKEILPEARSLAEKAGLDIYLVEADFTLDGKRLTFSCTTEKKVDWRDFVRELGNRYRTRAEIRQIGARDRAKLAGGYGICGRELCCASWLTTFPSISIRMAKNQERPLNPEKISGLCGRLLCCLSYEDEGYKEMRRTLPRLGQRCSTPTGEGKVIAVNVLAREVTLSVAGQRIAVPDRDLGTVVRWDPSARNADPPPSMPREEDAEPVGAAVAAPEPPRPQSPAEERERPAGRRQRAPRSRGDDERPATDDMPQQGRRFQRRTGDATPSPPPPRSEDDAGSDAPRPRRRRRGRRGGRGKRGS